MATDDRMVPAVWARWLNVILGAWLIISPWVVGPGDPAATWNTLIVGVVILLVALFAFRSADSTPSWLNVVLAVWLIIAPWVLGFSSAVGATANSVVLGVIVGLLSLTASLAEAAPGRRLSS
jgi:hypothetical protein